MLSDQHGELILPIVRGARAERGMPALPLPDADVIAVAEYIHSVAGHRAGPGRPARERCAAAQRARRRCEGGRSLLRGEVQQLPLARPATCRASARGSPRERRCRTTGSSAAAGGGRGGRGAGCGHRAVRSAQGDRDGHAAHGEKVQGRSCGIDNFLVTLRLR